MSYQVTPWEWPSNYSGHDWSGWYSAGFGQHRDSDALERANFETAWEALKTERTIPDDIGDTIRPCDVDEYTVQKVRERHWAVGWVEWIAIHQTDTDALAKARQLCERANDYPILDEDRFSRIEGEDCQQTWANCYSPRERIEYFRSHGHTVTSIGALLRAVRGDWYEAANMLHCPSDLL